MTQWCGAGQSGVAGEAGSTAVREQHTEAQNTGLSQNGTMAHNGNCDDDI